MIAETAADTAPRDQAWEAAGADPEGIAALLHYTAIRLATDLRHVSDNLPVDLGVMAAATEAAQGLALLLEACTVRSLDDPRADELATAAGRIDGLFAADYDTADFITPRPTGPTNAPTLR